MNLVHTFESFLNEGIANQKLEAAIEKIDSLPVGKIFDDAKRIDDIFDITKHSWSDVVNAFEKAQDSAKVQQVNLNDIHITQPNIQANKVKKMMADINKTPTINVVQFKNGEKVIYDGHHRLLANWALGENRIKVNLVKI
jgi:hypothetical protein